MITLPLLVVACVSPQAKTFTSRSGEIRLEVEDKDDGTSGLTLRDSGGPRWTRAVQHSMNGVYVCEDGIVVAHGIQDPKDNPGFGSHVLTILGPTGEPRLMELCPILSRISHVGPRPNVQGCLVWEAIDTCAFWIDDVGRPDQLWIYNLAGVREGVVEPETLLAQAARQNWDAILLEVRPLNGTNLFLTTFRCMSKMQGNPGSFVSHNLFGAAALLDTRGKLLWWELMPEGHFLGTLREVSSTKDDHRWEVDVLEVVEGTEQGRPPEYECVGLVPLQFQRDPDGAWKKR